MLKQNNGGYSFGIGVLLPREEAEGIQMQAVKITPWVFPRDGLLHCCPSAFALPDGRDGYGGSWLTNGYLSSTYSQTGLIDIFEVSSVITCLQIVPKFHDSLTRALLFFIAYHKDPRMGKLLQKRLHTNCI